MDNTLREISRDVTIINELGLHARAAAMIVQLSQKARAKVWIIKDGEKVDASSVIDILTLACVKDAKIQLRIDDYLDLNILNNIAELVESGFGE